MSSSVEYAKSELARITKDGDGLQDAINKNVLDIVELFASQGHGEISAGYVMSVLERLLRLQPLLPPIIPLTPPLKQINCLRPHAKMVRQLRQPKMTTRCFAKVLSPYNPLSPKAIPLASIADRKRELT